MFERFDAIVYKVSEYCNLDCVYCFQKHDVKERTRGFTYFNELIKLLITLPLADDFEIKVTGGESSLHCDKIRQDYKKFKKIERYKETNIQITTISNGSNINGLIDLWNDGILNPWGCKISWDGIYSASKSRKPKNIDVFNDDYFNRTITTLGKSDYNDKVLVRTACTPDTIDNLYDAYKFALDNGCYKWEYYPLSDCDYYKDPDFLKKFEEQLYYIFEENALEENRDKIVANVDTMLYTNNMTEKERLRSISCRHLGHFLHVGIDGSLYPCGYFSDDAFYSNQTLKIGDVFTGLYPEVIDKFTKEYNQTPMCSVAEEDGCKCFHCFECPAVSKFYKNNLQNKMRQQCVMRHIEKKVFEDVYKNYVFDEDQIKRNFTYAENWNT